MCDHKSEDGSFFGYKTHIAMSGAYNNSSHNHIQGKGRRVGTTGACSAESQNGMEVETIIGDTVYSEKENFKLAQDNQKGFKLVTKLTPVISQGGKQPEQVFEYNKDAGMFVCPAGHMAI